MIPLVEDILLETIQNQLKVLRANVDIVDRIFAQATVSTRTKLKEYITNNQIKVMRGFPISQAQLPVYSIVLGAETENVEAIGNIFGDFTEEYEFRQTESNLEVKLLDGYYVVETPHKPLINVVSVFYNGVVYDESYLEILDDIRGIVRLLIPIDTSSSSNVILTYVYKTIGYLREGTMFHAQYRIETWTNNGDLTVSLYHLLKWIFLSKRLDMAEKGLVVQNLGGLDFEPAPEYFPEFVFRRALTFECQIEAVVEIPHGFIEGITISDDVLDSSEEI